VQHRTRQGRAIGERAIATLKTWKLLSGLRCLQRAIAITQAILVLQHIEDGWPPRKVGKAQ
jgi:hypothetical protein